MMLFFFCILTSAFSYKWPIFFFLACPLEHMKLNALWIPRYGILQAKDHGPS
jgi:hypothetical protein